MAYQEHPKSPVITAVTVEFLPIMPKPLTSLVEAPVHTVETRLFDLSSNLRSQLMSQHGLSTPVSVSVGSESIGMSTQEELDCQLQLLSGGKDTQAPRTQLLFRAVLSPQIVLVL